MRARLTIAECSRTLPSAWCFRGLWVALLSLSIGLVSIPFPARAAEEALPKQPDPHPTEAATNAVSASTNAPSATTNTTARMTEKTVAEETSESHLPPRLSVADLPANTNLLASASMSALIPDFAHQLEIALQLHQNGQQTYASKKFLALVESAAPREIKQTALLEMAKIAEEEHQLSNAQRLLNQFLKSWPDDAKVPEILFRQGVLYRQAGATEMAITKLYGVMTASINLKQENLEYYQRLVLQAQVEVAETHNLLGEFNKASDYYTRLLKLDSPELDKQKIRFKLIRALSMQDLRAETIAQAGIFKQLHPDAPEMAEVHYMLANSYRKLGRTREALQEVMELLKSQQASADKDPKNWIYWQQRTGNDIANELYQQGAYVDALTVYMALSQLNPSPAWQFPVFYQIGLIFERLQQPQKAADTYQMIVGREKELDPTKAAPSLSAVVDMARWRIDHLKWKTGAERANMDLAAHKPFAATNTVPTEVKQ